MVDIVRKKLNYSLFETVVIGDRLYTDIMTGINAGVTSVCVLTGEATVNDIQQGSIKPTYTFIRLPAKLES
ncbi:phosphotransferase [Streptococcus pneumoniae]|nr:phosphotransferase [Streptococcus pneumoniae]